ncbi:hypothetical protein BDR26DRAFT_809545 [Obelidium mucronatum]|nr:hypothetical protein BDR26DRAFT_809545 [Obelidium mucronatum]
MEAVRKFFSDPSTTSEKTAKKYGGKTRVSVGHVKDDERNYEEFGFCYSPFDRFLPGVFLVVWSCGHIMDIGKMYSFESNKFITGFLCQTFMRLDEYPTFMFYDKACVFVRTLKNGAQQIKPLHKNHSRPDRFCMENCDARSFSRLYQGNKPLFNTSAAEQCAGWFEKMGHILRYLDPLQADFFLFSMVDMRNEQLSKC